MRFGSRNLAVRRGNLPVRRSVCFATCNIPTSMYVPYSIAIVKSLGAIRVDRPVTVKQWSAKGPFFTYRTTEQSRLGMALRA